MELDGISTVFQLTSPLKCVTFVMATHTFLTTTCTEEFPVVCEKPDTELMHHLDLLKTQVEYYKLIAQIKEWISKEDAISLITPTYQVQDQACPNAIAFFEDPFPSPYNLSISVMHKRLDQFLHKFDIIKGLFLFLQQAQHFPLHKFESFFSDQHSLCLSFDLSPSFFDQSTFFTFSITDLGLASGSLMLAGLTAFNIYRTERRNKLETKKQKKAKDIPMTKRVRTVSFSDELHQLGRSSSTPSLVSSLGPENYYY